eukprot:CAMPEP_0204607764 /NCGR_PEP_ID=MMETSP0661-20131031/59913_1 /ASSEMBLY_ACC=CAM_ASM_000606 /TAXON_ID=109239 /ORGANISM="Alexandrium margalefi, Strain AMGDE01CS-322" /LENGTH=48 /DNA_ID= /DNA_START= /DNA_END= /DNA_ORIENTATION=
MPGLLQLVENANASAAFFKLPAPCAEACAFKKQARGQAQAQIDLSSSS